MQGTTGKSFALPAPEDSWNFGAVVAILCAAGISAPDTFIDADGLRYDDGGGNWWGLVWVDGGRAVLVGDDLDYSETRSLEDDPSFDLLAGAPEWFPHTWFHRIDVPVGFVYWWDGAWDRTEYPPEVGDDGHSIATTFRAAEDIHQLIFEEYSQRESDPAAQRALDDLIERVRDRFVDEAQLAELLARIDPDADPHSAVIAAESAGLVPGWPRPVVPAE